MSVSGHTDRAIFRSLSGNGAVCWWNFSIRFLETSKMTRLQDLHITTVANFCNKCYSFIHSFVHSFMSFNSGNWAHRTEKKHKHTQTHKAITHSKLTEENKKKRKK